MDRTENLQRGIAIAPILFVVAILAVLASAIAAGSGALNGDTSDVQAKAQATAILEYANEVKFAIDRLLAKGCKDTEISFENPFVSGYTNPNAPSDKSCHVFDVNGGGIVWKEPDARIYSAIKKGKNSTRNGGHWLYHGHICVGGVGSATSRYFGQSMPYCRHDSSPASLVMATHDIKPSVCDALNTMLGVELLSSGNNYSSNSDVMDYNYFRGTYGKSAANGYDARATIGKMMGCAKVVDGAPYDNTYFYSVLIPR